MNLNKNEHDLQVSSAQHKCYSYQSHFQNTMIIFNKLFGADQRICGRNDGTSAKRKDEVF